MDKAANYVLFVVEEYGRPLQTVCKEIAGDDWNALRHRAQQRAKRAGQTPDERAHAILKEGRSRRSAKKSRGKDGTPCGTGRRN